MVMIRKVTKNTIYSKICIICPYRGKWSILYVIQKKTLFACDLSTKAPHRTEKFTAVKSFGRQILVV